MPLTSTGQSQPEALLQILSDSAVSGSQVYGPLNIATVTFTVPAGYTAVLDSSNNLVVTGPPSSNPGVAVGVKQGTTTIATLNVPVWPAVSELSALKDTATSALSTANSATTTANNATTTANSANTTANQALNRTISVASSGITDSTIVGRSVLTAADAVSARLAIGFDMAQMQTDIANLQASVNTLQSSKADAGNVATAQQLSDHLAGLHTGHPVFVYEDPTTGWTTAPPTVADRICIAASNTSAYPSWYASGDLVFRPQAGAVAPVFAYQWTGEGYADGAALVDTTAQPGSGDAIDNLSVPVGTSATATSSPVVLGSRAGLFSVNAGATNQQVFAAFRRASLGGVVTEGVFGAIMQISALPTANVVLLRVRNLADATTPTPNFTRAYLRITPTGTIQLLDSGNANAKTTVATVAAGENFWLELHHKSDGTNAYALARLTKANGTAEELGSLTVAGNYGQGINSMEAGLMSNISVATGGTPVTLAIGEARSRVSTYVRDA